MLIRKHATCAICQLRTVVEMPCPNRRSRTAALRRFVCDECATWHEFDEADPDVARLVAAYRDFAREDDGW
jgi:hypothetical protein